MDDLLRKLQLTQLGILHTIDAFCRANRISYSLYGGTLLGAVRHHGFIPWDDDVDVCMGRSEYDRFVKLWSFNPPEGYILQNKENTPRFTQSFSKVRKEHTTFLQSEREAGCYHTGIFVDVFPIDRIPNGAVRRKLFQLDCMYYQLLTREYIPPRGSRLQKTVSKTMLAVLPANRREHIRKTLLGKITKYREESLDTVAIETLSTIRITMPPELLKEYTELRFEDGEFMCFTMWREYLTLKYGDYMQLPPEEERTWKHHPIVLDFDRDLQELEQQT